MFTEPSVDQAETVRTAGGDQTLALFTDDLLHPVPHRHSPKSWKCSQSFSGYKVNVNKTQVLTLNYDPPIEMKNHCKWKWDAGSIRYVGG